MKKIYFTLLFVLLNYGISSAQDAVWHTDMKMASKIAMKENKPIMLFFTGSDWCGWCKRLQSEVLDTSDFEKWASDNVVLVELDFPRRTALDQATKQQNYQLQSMFKVRGYPTIHFVNPKKETDGKINLAGLGKTGYVRGGPKKWLEVANNIIKKNKSL